MKVRGPEISPATNMSSHMTMYSGAEFSHYGKAERRKEGEREELLL